METDSFARTHDHAQKPAGISADDKENAPSVPFSMPSFDEVDHARYFVPRKSPAQIRNMINRYMRNTDTKVGDFCKTLGVSNRSYNSFLKTNGSGGSQSETYVQAHMLFDERERRGLPAVPKPQKKRKSDTATTEKGSDGKSKSKTNGKAPTAADVADIKLSGEPDHVPVYDTCDVVRRHIDAHLRKDGATQAQLSRDLSAMVDGCDVSARNLATFRNRKGANDGAKSPAFYAGYIFFEKLRIKEGKPKSKFREEMENHWGADGFDRESDANSRFFCLAGERPTMDKYGRLNF